VERQRHGHVRPTTSPNSLRSWISQRDPCRPFHRRRRSRRYIARHGTKRVAKVVLIGAVPPLMLKTPANPGGHADRRVRQNTRQRPGRSLAILEGFEPAVLRLQPLGREGLRRGARVVLAAGHDGGLPAAYFCIKAFSETDQTEELKKINVPTLIMQGDDDQIVPFADSGSSNPSSSRAQP